MKKMYLVDFDRRTERSVAKLILPKNTCGSMVIQNTFEKKVGN